MSGAARLLRVRDLQADWSAVGGRIPAYLRTFPLTVVNFRGQEELGGLGFALPQLQQRRAQPETAARLKPRSS